MQSDKQSEFLKAYQSCHEPFVRYCAALASGKMDTEDLVQDVLLSAYLHFSRIRQKDQLLHYLIRAARKRSISLWRTRQRRKEILARQRQKWIDQGISPEVSLDIQILYQALDRLPTKQKDAIILFEISGFSMREIAELQQSTPGAVKTAISRGRQKLKALMAEGTTRTQLPVLFKTAQSILL